MIINTEDDYQYALKLLDHLMTKAEDREGEPLLPLIDMVADAIEQYEDGLESIKLFKRRIDSIDPATALFRVLIDQYGLIITVENHKAALARIEELWAAEPNTPEGDELDALVTLVNVYEDVSNFLG